jgi:hypothetical protein
MFLLAPYAAACKQTVSLNFKNSTLISLDDHRHGIHAPACCPPLSPATAYEADREKGDPSQ